MRLRGCCISERLETALRRGECTDCLAAYCWSQGTKTMVAGQWKIASPPCFARKLLLSSTANKRTWLRFLHFFRGRNCLINEVKTGFENDLFDFSCLLIQSSYIEKQSYHTVVAFAARCRSRSYGRMRQKPLTLVQWLCSADSSHRGIAPVSSATLPLPGYGRVACYSPEPELRPDRSRTSSVNELPPSTLLPLLADDGVSRRASWQPR